MSRLTVNQLEDVVEDKVLLLGVASQLEGLRIVHRALLLIDLERTTVSSRRLDEIRIASYQKLASHQNDDAAFDHGGLSIEGGDLVLDLLEGKRLLRQLSAIV